MKHEGTRAVFRHGHERVKSSPWPLLQTSDEDVMTMRLQSTAGFLIHVAMTFLKELNLNLSIATITSDDHIINWLCF